MVAILLIPLAGYSQETGNWVEKCTSVLACELSCPGGSALQQEDNTMWCEQSGERNGPYVKWHENGSRAEVGEYQNGVKQGTWIQWYDNGQMREQAIFSNDNTHGLMTEWHPNGQKSAECHLEKGKRHGRFIKWSDEGVKILLRNYQRGRLHGDSTSWYPSGKKKSAAKYINGRKHGVEIEWHENGKTAATVRYAMGNKKGKAIRWYASGRKKSEGEYQSGRKSGKWTFWPSEKGGASRTSCYYNGIESECISPSACRDLKKKCQAIAMQLAEIELKNSKIGLLRVDAKERVKWKFLEVKADFCVSTMVGVYNYARLTGEDSPVCLEICQGGLKALRDMEKK